jgi:hypothetical protein
VIGYDVDRYYIIGRSSVLQTATLATLQPADRNVLRSRHAASLLLYYEKKGEGAYAILLESPSNRAENKN